MKNEFVKWIIGITLALAAAGSGVAAWQTIFDSPSPQTHQLEVIIDPGESADFLQNPKPDSQGRYHAGTTVTIEVLPREDWKIKEWVGAPYLVSGNTAKVNMDSNKSLVVRLTR